ncbi:chemotaxis protein CheA [Sulfuriflexus sp.]|uniref:chemotaxis protein CheA n=1 Tax=Sulfuriflexus sp. TaxID=2015443 RepID=UPI0028CD6D8F|nr:chemotaxis protein CheA [Sulfuriflexus sp.]MDT8404578.1 chemotaxis protein CheA [Sulfuriflexus sp.]
MSIDMRQFHQTFFEESFEGLDIMETELLGLDIGDTDIDVINTIFRAAHSIKGGSGTFGFNDVAEFTHVAETLLDEMRDGVRPVTQTAVEILLKSVDIIRGMLTALRDEGEMDAAQVAEVKAELDSLLGDKGAEASSAPVADDTGSSITSTWTIRFKPHTEMLRTGNDPVRMLRALADLGDLDVRVNISDLPGFNDLNPEDAFLSWEMSLNGEVTEADILEVFEWVDDECDLEITAAATATSAENVSPESVAASLATTVKDSATATVSAKEATVPAARTSKPAKTSETTSIRVDIDKVDEIINLVGELVITQSMLGQMGGDFEETRNIDTARLEKLREGLGQLERNTRELQESVMRIRMLPISFVFSRMPRLIHDLSGKLDKKVNLVITGEHTELDKTVMEKIGDPMVHLVRNALDHGLETPERRVAAGKSETGTLNLNAYHQGGNIIIEIFDDGAGLNREKIHRKAIERGIITADDNLTDEMIEDMIFHPGFSTADQVSDVSGRGVGMDVVRKNIKALGGKVEVKSEEGAGAKFTIRLPLTLAILDGQLVRVGDDTYVIPLISIIESIQVNPEHVNAVAGKAELYKLRNEYIPVIRAHRIFGMHEEENELAGRLMVVVEGDGHRAGVIVDDLLAQQQVVIKSLETNYRRVEGMSGATILGDGTVALILDIAGLVNMFRGGRYDMPPPAPIKPGGSAANSEAA